MDKRIEDRARKIHEQIDRLEPIEKQALYLEAHKKVLFSQLYLTAKGKNVAEKEANVYVSKDWQDFITGYCEVQAAYNAEKRRYELKLKAFDGEYLSAKIEAAAIPRSVG